MRTQPRRRIHRATPCNERRKQSKKLTKYSSIITEIKKPISKIKERDPLTEKIIACAYKVHSELGPGFNEKIYHNSLNLALNDAGLKYSTKSEYKVDYRSRKVGTLRIDLIIENSVIVEVKAVTGIMPRLFEAQLLSYMKVSGYNVGLLINFGNKSCKIRRLNLKSP
ncbi:MAG: GxxExxY protein [Candidatus Omnitrophica bacterium]|nr:GxxExxY protein [Candidatus Omnitrophota bacterium]